MALNGKVALVTGSARGIGKAVALRLADEGADVVVHHRGEGRQSLARAQETCEALQAKGVQTLVQRADIAVADDIRNMMAAVRDWRGQVDVLVLNAARAPFKPLEKLLEVDLRQLVETNFTGNILMVREALKLMGPGGKIVFISSLGSRFYSPSYPLGAMKGAMESAVRHLAESLADRDVAVNAVCGGLVKTDSFKTLRLVWEGLDRLPDSCCVEPEEIADVVSFLCGPGARGIRGQTIVVDRGLSNRLGVVF